MEQLMKVTLRRRPLFLFWVGILLLLGFSANLAIAQSIDQKIVIDDARLFESKIEEVEAAAQSLIIIGVDIRIRTISTYGTAVSLDQYEDSLEKQSPSWTDQYGSLKSNLVILIISFQERETGLYYGSDLADILKDEWKLILDDTMNPRFKNGDFSGGTAAGIKEIQRLVQESRQTPTGTSRQTQWWIIPLVVLAVIGIIIGLIIFFYLQKTRAKISAARQKAMLAKQGAAADINKQLETLQMLEIKVNVTANRITPEEAVPLWDGLQKAKNLVDRCSETYSNLAHSAGDPENPKLGEAQLAAIESEYKKILGDLSQGGETIKEVETNVALVQQTADSFQNEVSKIQTDITKVRNKQEELQKAGFRIDYLTGLISTGSNTLAQAKTMVAGKQVLGGTKQLELARNQVETAMKATDELPQRKQEAEKAIETLSSRIEQVKLTVDNGRDNFERVAAVYADSTWQSIQGNGTEAENRVNWAIEAMEDAKTAVGTEQQDWPQAIKSVEAGNKWLNEAVSLIQSISILESNLKIAQQDAPNEINAARTDIQQAWDYINRYDEDIRESLEDDLRTAENKNIQAGQELNKDRPDYFEVCKLSRDANESADRILIQARTEHETAERLRNKAASTRRDASTRVSIARKYIEDHYQVVKQDARSSLISGEETLRQAEATLDVNSQISLALKAEAAANQAYSLAQNDVNNSWQRPTSTSSGTSGQGIPPVIVPNLPRSTTSRPSGGSSSWGSPRPGRPSPSGTIRTGGGSSSWSSRGSSRGGGSRGGGSRGW